MITPAGYRVLVKADSVEEVTEAGIIVYSNERDLLLEKAAQTFGTLVAVGESAWHDQPSAWAKVGDRVSYSKHGGKFIKDPETGEEFVILNDDDITSIIVGDNS